MLALLTGLLMLALTGCSGGGDDDPDDGVLVVPVADGPVLDAARTTTAVLEPAGGTLTIAEAADGTGVTLDVPAGALLAPQSITMTALRGLNPWSLAGRVLFGADLAPDGFQFYRGAVLTVRIPAGIDAATLIGFGYAEDGSDLHLLPIEIDGRDVRIVLSHFSGYGVATVTEADVVRLTAATPGSEQLLALQRIAQAQRSIPVDASAQVQALAQWYVTAVRPQLVASGADTSATRATVAEYIAWTTAVQQWGLIDLDADLAEAESLLAVALRFAFEEANDLCSRSGSIDDTREALFWLGVLQAFGMDDGGDLDGLCLRLELEADSTRIDTGDSTGIRVTPSLADGSAPIAMEGRTVRFFRTGSGSVTPATTVIGPDRTASTTFQAPDEGDGTTVITAALDLGGILPVTGAIEIAYGTPEPEYSDEISVDRMIPQFFEDTLLIRGRFPDPEDPVNNPLSVTIDGVPVVVRSSNSSEIKVDLPLTGPGSAGPVRIRAGTKIGRPALLTEWQGTITATNVTSQVAPQEARGSVTFSGTANVRFRAYVRDGGSAGASNTSDSTATLTATGGYSRSCCPGSTSLYSGGSDSAPVSLEIAILDGDRRAFVYSLIVGPVTNALRIETTFDETPPQVFTDYVTFGANCANLPLQMDDNLNIQGGSVTTTQNGDPGVTFTTTCSSGGFTARFGH